MVKHSNRKNSYTEMRGWHIAEIAVTYAFFALALILFGVTCWLQETFGLSFQQLLYTLVSPLEGSDMSVVPSCLKACIPYFLVLVCLILFGVAVCQLKKRFLILLKLEVFHWKHEFNLLSVIRHFMLLASVILLVGSFLYIDDVLNVSGYIERRMHPTTIYEERYVEPATAGITAPQEKKNLIYIYMESMETTYSSTVVGGRQPVNYMPNLTELAQNNVSFSNSTRLGGWHAASGTTWTIASLFATNSGVPFSFPERKNKMSTHQYFAPGCTTLGDILEDNGYRSMFLCGSDAAFAGRDKFFSQHGNYDISDLISARAEGYIPADYHDGWWGYEDYTLYEIAKDKVLELAQSEQPFNFTMLTVDTHHVNGHVCPLCQDAYDSTTANVVSCADRQVADFIEWLRQQDFYEDTVIVITGDHPRMDKQLVKDAAYYDRTIYNCFINCPVPDGTRLTNREFTAMDIFPTVLSALGFDFEGDQLGLGVNLFSETRTLSEEMGYEAFDAELSKYSPYFTEYFSVSHS